MAQEFLNASDPTETYNDYILGDAILSAGYPVTINVWFYPPSIGVIASTDLTMVFLGNSTDICHHKIHLNTTTSRVIGQSKQSSGAFANAITTVNYTAAAWNMATYVCTSATSRTAYINAGGSATSTISRPVTAPTYWDIGHATYERYLAEFSVWDQALTATEITSLYRGVKAEKIRPQSLKIYVPLVRNHTDTRGLTTSITSSFPSGASVKDHVRRYG